MGGIAPQSSRTTARNSNHTGLWIGLAASLFLVVGIMAAALWGGGIFSNQPTGRGAYSQASKGTEPLESYIAKERQAFLDRYKNALNVSAQDFFKTYQNQLAGDQAYKGKLIVLSVIPWKLDTNDWFDHKTRRRIELGPPYAMLSLSGKREDLVVCCEFDNEQRYTGYDQRELLSHNGGIWSSDGPVNVAVKVVGECQGIGLPKGSSEYGLKAIRLVQCAVLTTKDEIQTRKQALVKGEEDARAKADAEAERQVREDKAISITAGELQHPLGFRREEWRGKVLEVTGTVETVGEEYGELFVMLRGITKCFFKAKHRSELAQLQPAQAVRIRGKLRDLYGRAMEHCILVK